MRYEFKEKVSNRNKVTMGIGLGLMTLGLFKGSFNMAYSIIYILGLIAWIKILTRKEASIVITEDTLSVIKSDKNKLVIELSQVGRMRLIYKSTQMYRREVLEISVGNDVYDIAIVNYESEALIKALQEVCQTGKVLLEAS